MRLKGPFSPPTQPKRSASSSLSLGLLSALAALPSSGWAQEAPASKGSATRISPFVETRVTASDNVNLSATNKDAGFIFEVVPGINVRHQSPRLTVDLGASLRASTTDQGNSSSSLSMNGSLLAALYERNVFLDATANVSQQSPFGTFLPDSVADTTGEREEVRSFSISPHARGRVGGLLYETRYRVSQSSGSNAALSNATTNTLSGSLRTPIGQDAFDVGVSAEYSHEDFRNFDTYENAQWLATLGWTPSRTLRLYVDGGQERNGFRTVDNPVNDIYDAGLTWAPTLRTQLNASYGERFYGNNYNFNMTHRLRMASFNVSRSRSLVNSRDLLLVPFADTVASGLDQALRSRYPDPSERAVVVGNMIEQFGLPTSLFTSFFLITNKYYVQTRSTASLTLLSLRNVVTASAYRSESVLAESAGADGEFLVFGNNLRQRGGGLDWRYILDGRTTTGASFSHVRSLATATATDSQTNMLQVYFNRQLGGRSSAGLTYRHIEREDALTVDNAKENALIATYRIQF